ncbi:sugar ABC transporter substrate-binding protein [Dactylosporangium sp. NBC_01737]|uniref:sugar ABC transporter substrate-binding protein n=1 Tax=Dactylosporangium sp. NBC_01737 TaxID=2975959 RepID=UPI002E161C7A|nr:sugar ABC transporter substrate-binding protein [Dactylosporangium sp. NBC_01737]
MLALALAIALAGCGDAKSDTPSGAAGSIKVGLITKFPVDFYDTMVDAVKQYDAAHSDVEVVYGQGKSGTDDEGEIAIIENMITQGVKAIAITPTSPNVQGALDKAVKAGIKVVLIDNDIPGWSGKSSVVATDNLAGGKLAGQWLAKQLPAGATIAILQGRLGNPSLDDRVKGLKDGLGGAAKVVAEPATDCDETKGLNAAQDILTANPDVTAIYGACGPPITGALQAVKATGKKPIVVGFDASPDEIKAIEAGTQAASVAQFPAKMGSLGIETAVAAAKGQTVQPSVDTGTEMVTKDNVAKFK